MDIYEAGGGIHFTVNHTRNASEDELYGLLRQRLMRMLANGTLVSIRLLVLRASKDVTQLIPL